MDIQQADAFLKADAENEPAVQAELEKEQPGADANQEPHAAADEGGADASAADGEGEQGGEGEAADRKAAPTTVPLAVHIREREKYRQERLAWERQQQLVNERLAQLFAERQAAQQEPAPDPDTDPLGYQIHLQKQTQQQVEQLARERQQERAQAEAMARQQQAVQYVAQKVSQDEQEFVSRTPDYKEAIKHARDVKFAEYTALGMTDEQASQRLQQDAWALSIYAAENGFNAAEYAYTVAQALGYRKGAAAAQGTNVLDMRSKGVKTAVSGGAGGKKTAPTFADLAAMSNDEFAKLTKGDNWQKFAGG